MAVYTDIAPEDLDGFLSRYDIGAAVSFHGIAEGVENSNFRLETHHGQFILTVYEKRVDPADLPFFLGLMEHLSSRGFACPLPVKAQDGNALQSINGKPAAIVTFLQGRSPRRRRAEQCMALGRTLARLHLAGDGFKIGRTNALGPHGWRPLFDRSCQSRPGPAPELQKEIEAELGRLLDQWPQDLPKGVIHADLFPDNVFFDEDRVTGVIDFYFACNDLLAYDLAIVLNAWCFEDRGEFNITKARALVSGYQEVRPLTSQEIEALPILCSGSALRFYLTRLYDWLNQVEGALVQPHDPGEFLRKLRFHRQSRGPEALGLGIGGR